MVIPIAALRASKLPVIVKRALPNGVSNTKTKPSMTAVKVLKNMTIAPELVINAVSLAIATIRSPRAAKAPPSLDSSNPISLNIRTASSRDFKNSPNPGEAAICIRPKAICPITSRSCVKFLVNSNKKV